MLKRILVISVCFAILLSFASCKAGKGEKEKTTVTETQTTTVTQTQKQTEKQTTQPTTKKQTKKSKKSKKSKKEDKTEKNTSKAVTKKNDDGTFNIKGVKVDVVKYSGTDLNNGKKLIESLIKGAIKDATVLDKTRVDNRIAYLISGKDSNTGKTKFYRLQYIQDGSVGYLITYTADSRQAFERDLSYVTDNYKDLAR